MTPFVVPPEARSWVEVRADSDFPIQNLPFGVCTAKDRGDFLAVPIGDCVLDLFALGEAGLIDDGEFPILDSFIELDRAGLSALRKVVFELLVADNPTLRDDGKLCERALLPAGRVQPRVPIPPNAFVDFYSGIHHASNVGRMFRPDQPPLLPNYRWLPIGYNGRASSVVASGTPIVRPKGQTKAPDADAPVFGPTQALDFELEIGFYVGHGNEMGKRITCSAAEDHVLGLVVVNDWSARDVQTWEYQPLGPFLAKSFATSVSPWIVTLDALEPFRVEGMPQEPPPLPYLRHHGKPHFDVVLEAWLRTARATRGQRIAVSNTRFLYWSISQQLAHQTSNGTPVEGGDLYASGTISGPTEDSCGSMLEATWRGQRPITIEETGETRSWLEDGDTLTLRAWAQGDGYRVGFGDCTGSIKPSL